MRLASAVASLAVGDARSADADPSGASVAVGDAKRTEETVAIVGARVGVLTTLATWVMAGVLRIARGTAPLGGVRKYRYETAAAAMMPNEASPAYMSLDGWGVSGESPGGSGVKWVTIEVHHSKVGGRRKL